MNRARRRLAWMAVVALGLIGSCGAGLAEAADAKPGTWTGGAGLGFLSSTPDGTAFALNANAEVFAAPILSIGPLLQLGFTGDSSQVGLSGQVKFWVEIPGTPRRLQLTPQAGIGFVHNTFRDEDTSWLIPLGVGADYSLTDQLSVTGTFLLNFTDLDTGRGKNTHVMPGFTVGVRF